MGTRSNERCLHFCLLIALGLLYLGGTTHGTKDAHAKPCNGSIAECDEDYEHLMETEISRRFLEQKKYISPGALKRDQPVCNGGARGEAYSNSGGCLPPPSNPENRGCPKYYRCRSDS
ncbi:hypothetical protein L1049_016579 [Liquidambar formosana]|uniref:Protein RALF-like 32 n=1 Tax=Liquidambar formosana TaxID=63359 RepID=A0AAP0X369_LIQFO